MRFHQGVELHHLPLNFVERLDRQPFHRPLCNAVDLFNAYYDVSSAEVVDVVGKSTDSTIDGNGIPTLFEFYSVGFDFTLGKQFFYVDW